MAVRTLLRPLVRASKTPCSLVARASTTSSPRVVPAARKAPAPSPPNTTTAPVPESAAYDPAAAAQTRPKIDLSAAKQLAATPPAPSLAPGSREIDWSRSYHGLSEKPFAKEVAAILSQPLDAADVEVKPDGIIYLPEIKYRRILNAAFGPGGWGLVPKSDVVVGDRIVTREYALVAEGRFVSQAQGENQYFSLEALPSAVEGCKSNALMRCCKDLGVASELWDPVYIRAFRKEHITQKWVEHVVTKKKKQLYLKKGDSTIPYPYKASGAA